MNLIWFTSVLLSVVYLSASIAQKIMSTLGIVELLIMVMVVP